MKYQNDFRDELTSAFREMEKKKIISLIKSPLFFRFLVFAFRKKKRLNHYGKERNKKKEVRLLLPEVHYRTSSNSFITKKNQVIYLLFFSIKPFDSMNFCFN